jgi:hypothetical protein
MNFLDARLEFQIRRYRWAKAKVEEEVRESFPHFWIFKGGMSWQYYKFLKQLCASEQYLYLRANLKRSYREAAAALNEVISPEEQVLLDGFSKFLQIPTELEKELITRKKLGEKIKFASKPKLQKAMIKIFSQAFNKLGLESVEYPGDSVPMLRFKCCGWIIQTDFEFGPSHRQMIFYHLIASEQRIFHPDNPRVTAPTMVLGYRLCWTGMCYMQWDYLNDSDIDPACDSVVQLCREFFDELPNLLKGLECENVMPDPLISR